MTLQTKLDEMRKRCEAATPGPWQQTNFSGKVICKGKREVENVHSHGTRSWTDVVATPAHGFACEPGCDAWKNMQFIAAARNDLPLLISALEVCLGALEEFRLGHVHAADLSHTRAFGDNYGWCDYCQTKVSWGPGDAEIALAKAEALLVGEGKDVQ